MSKAASTQANSRMLRRRLAPLLALALGIPAAAWFLQADGPVSAGEDGPAQWLSAPAGAAVCPPAPIPDPAATPEHKGPLPGGRGTDEEYARGIEAGRARQRQFVLDFMAQGRDPRCLVRMSGLPHYALPPASLEKAVEAAEAIVVGRVERTRFFTPAGQTLASARSRIAVERVLKGRPRDPLFLLQPGGPALCSGPGGKGVECLYEDYTGEVVLPGDEVVLFLRSASRASDAYLAFSGAAVYYIRDGNVVPLASNSFGASLAPKSKAKLIAAIERELFGRR